MLLFALPVRFAGFDPYPVGGERRVHLAEDPLLTENSSRIELSSCRQPESLAEPVLPSSTLGSPSVNPGT